MQMPDLSGVRLGFALCGSFCNAARAVKAAETCACAGAAVLPVVSEHFASLPTRFGVPEDFLAPLRELSGGRLIRGGGADRPQKPDGCHGGLSVHGESAGEAGRGHYGRHGADGGEVASAGRQAGNPLYCDE